MKPLAVLTCHPHWAVEDLHAELGVANYDSAKRQGTLQNGRDFLIITHEEQLHSREISGFRLLGPGQVDVRLVAIAEAMVR